MLSLEIPIPVLERSVLVVMDVGRLSVEALARRQAVRRLVLQLPSNATGHVLAGEILRALEGEEGVDTNSRVMIRYLRDSKAVPFPLNALVQYESAHDIVGYICLWESGYTAWQVRHRVLLAIPGGEDAEYGCMTAYAGLPLCVAVAPWATFSALRDPAERWAALCTPHGGHIGGIAAHVPLLSYCVSSREALTCVCGDADCCVSARSRVCFGRASEFLTLHARPGLYNSAAR